MASMSFHSIQDIPLYILLPFFLTGVFAVLTYVVPFVYHITASEQNLKKKYDASWALVTGGSSGIGAAIVEKLAQQGINVVIAALGDSVLDEFYANVVKKYPNQTFRKIAVDLSHPDQILSTILPHTDDIFISLLFNNAGYITTGLFTDISLSRNLANYHCNATSAIPLTHHFVGRMMERKRKGLVTFTASGAGFIPCPMSAMYGATKIFLNSFAASLAAEVGPDGIDVVCVNPSPVRSRFYENAGKMNALKFFKMTAVEPDAIASAIFSSAGRFVIRDHGYFSFVSKLGLKILDWNFLTEIMKMAIPQNGDYLNLRKKA